MTKGRVGVGRGLGRFWLYGLSYRLGGWLLGRIWNIRLLREKSRMHLPPLGDGLRLGLSLFDVAQLLLCHQRYVFVCFDH